MKFFEKLNSFKNTTTEVDIISQSNICGEIPCRAAIDSWLAFRQLL